MGACDLTFNRIVIQNQKSDSDHADNDWLHVAWVVGGPDNPHTIEQTLPLLNAQGSPILHSGDVIPEFIVSCNANDGDVVMAVYAITNLGSSDWGDQANQAAQITSKIAQAAADAYLEVAKQVLEAMASDVTGVPWINVVANAVIDPHWDAFLNVINGVINGIFMGIIGPVLSWIAGQVANLLGHPNCNGEVMHDYVIFVPNDQNNGSLSRVYAGPQDNSSCGEPPHTQVDITLHREVQFIGQFGPVVMPDPNDAAAREFRNRAEIAAQQGYPGAFPNFYYGMNGQAHVGGTIFIEPACGVWVDAPWSELGFPSLDAFSARMRATDTYALKKGYAGGFPNFFEGQQLSGVFGAGSALASRLASAPGWRPVSTRSSSILSFYGGVQTDVVGIVCGTVLIKEGCAVRRDVALSELGYVGDIGALFRAVQDYASKAGFVGGFPTFKHAVTGLGIVTGRGPLVASMTVVLLTAEAAVRRDVVLYWNPS